MNNQQTGEGNNSPSDNDYNCCISDPNSSLDRKISDFSSMNLTIRPNDVLCGRSKRSFNHVGNRRFRQIVGGSIEEYAEATSKWAKSMVAAKLVNQIHRDGGRFLKQKSGNQEDWYELSMQEAKAKASHAIRDAIAARDKSGKPSNDETFDKATLSSKPPAKRKKLSQKKTDPTSNSKGVQILHSMSPLRPLGNTSIHPGTGLTPLSSNFPLASTASPIFAAGGSQRPFFANSMPTSNAIQHQQMSQNFQQPGMPMAQMITNPMITPSFMSSMGPIPMQQQAYQQQQPYLRQLGAPDLTLRPVRQESKGSDGDADFLDLINNVLGPLEQQQQQERQRKQREKRKRA